MIVESQETQVILKYCILGQPSCLLFGRLESTDFACQVLSTQSQSYEFGAFKNRKKR